MATISPPWSPRRCLLPPPRVESTAATVGRLALLATALTALTVAAAGAAAATAAAAAVAATVRRLRAAAGMAAAPHAVAAPPRLPRTAAAAATSPAFPTRRRCKAGAAPPCGYRLVASGLPPDATGMCVVCRGTWAAETDASAAVDGGDATDTVATAVVSLACGHHFHADCIRSWLGVRPACPLCLRRVEGAGLWAGDSLWATK